MARPPGRNIWFWLPQTWLEILTRAPSKSTHLQKQKHWLGLRSPIWQLCHLLIHHHPIFLHLGFLGPILLFVYHSNRPFGHRGTILLWPLLWFVQCFDSHPACDCCPPGFAFWGNATLPKSANEEVISWYATYIINRLHSLWQRTNFDGSGVCRNDNCQHSRSMTFCRPTIAANQKRTWTWCLT